MMPMKQKKVCVLSMPVRLKLDEHLNIDLLCFALLCRKRKGAQPIRHFREEEDRQYGVGHSLQCFVSIEAAGHP